MKRKGARARPLVGITTYPKNDQGRYASPARYAEAVRRAGGEVVLLPPGARDPRRWTRAIDGLILTGGGDVDPKLYRGKPHPQTYGVDRTRDRNEIALILDVIARRMPFLAICRGLQLVNVALGGTLHGHVPDVFGTDIVHRREGPDDAHHAVMLDAGSALARIMGGRGSDGASFHHQAVDRVGRRLTVTGRSADRVVEGMELAGHPFGLLVQWHPEVTAHEDPAQQRLFAALVRAARP